MQVPCLFQVFGLWVQAKGKQGKRENKGDLGKKAVSCPKPLAFFPLILSTGSPLLAECLKQASKLPVEKLDQKTYFKFSEIHG